MQCRLESTCRSESALGLRIVSQSCSLPFSCSASPHERVLLTSQGSSRALKNFGKAFEGKRLRAIAAPRRVSIKTAKSSSIVRRKGGRLERDARGERRIQAAVSRGRPTVGHAGIRRLLDQKVSVGTCVLNYSQYWLHVQPRRSEKVPR